MCTATWWHQPGGYTLFFNRDELKRRAQAQPPQRFEAHGVAFLAPTDPDGGGTWLAVNAHGLTLALVNHYPTVETAEPDTEPRSRGLLVRDLAHLGHTLDTADQLARSGHAGLRRYAPFHLLALGPDQPTVQATWDGRELTRRHGRAVAQPLTGSSFDSQRIVTCRQTAFADSFGDAEATLMDDNRHRRFHRQHDAAQGAASVLMERPDARTVSYAEVEVTPREVILHYADRRDRAPAFDPASVHRLSRVVAVTALP
ncbi:MAG: NRDE family protein [Opitutales bacterium]